jgi:hypothetical protein
MKTKDGQIAHRVMLQDREIQEMLTNLAIRHAHVLRAMTEALFEVIQPMRQSSQQRPRVPIEHWRAGYRQSMNRTMSSIQITHAFLRESDDVTKSY